jgi:hypothetical protein
LLLQLLLLNDELLLNQFLLLLVKLLLLHQMLSKTRCSFYLCSNEQYNGMQCNSHIVCLV